MVSGYRRGIDSFVAGSFRKIYHRVADIELHSGSWFYNCFKAETETPLVVLDHHDRHHGASCPADFICPLADDVASATGNCLHSLSGFDPSSRHPCSRPEAGRGAEGNCEKLPP